MKKRSHLVPLLVDSICTCLRSYPLPPLLLDFLYSPYGILVLRGSRRGRHFFAVVLLRSSGVGSRAENICLQSGSRRLVVSRAGLRLDRDRTSL